MGDTARSNHVSEIHPRPHLYLQTRPNGNEQRSSDRTTYSNKLNLSIIQPAMEIVCVLRHFAILGCNNFAVTSRKTAYVTFWPFAVGLERMLLFGLLISHLRRSDLINREQELT
jgi:hypothetical protein